MILEQRKKLRKITQWTKACTARGCCVLNGGVKNQRTSTQVSKQPVFKTKLCVFMTDFVYFEK